MSESLKTRSRISITLALLKYLAIFYLGVALIITCSRLVVEYFSIKSGIDNEIVKLNENLSPILSNSIWEFNNIQTDTILKGLLHYPSISTVKLEYKDRSKVLKLGVNIKEENIFFKNIPFLKYLDLSTAFGYKKTLTTKQNNETIILGTLYTYSRNSLIFSKLKSILASSFISSVFIALGLWLGIFIFYKQKIKTPLSRFIEYVSSIDPESPQLSTEKNDKDYYEFFLVKNTFNKIINELTKFYKSVFSVS